MPRVDDDGADAGADAGAGLVCVGIVPGGILLTSQRAVPLPVAFALMDRAAQALPGAVTRRAVAATCCGTGFGLMEWDDDADDDEDNDATLLARLMAAFAAAHGLACIMFEPPLGAGTHEAADYTSRVVDCSADDLVRHRHIVGQIVQGAALPGGAVAGQVVHAYVALGASGGAVVLDTAGLLMPGELGHLIDETIMAAPDEDDRRALRRRAPVAVNARGFMHTSGECASQAGNLRAAAAALRAAGALAFTVAFMPDDPPNEWRAVADHAPDAAAYARAEAVLAEMGHALQ